MVLTSKFRVGWKNAIGMADARAVKLHRRSFSKIMGNSALQTGFNRVQEEEAAHFLMNVLDKPGDLNEHIKREAGAVVLKVVYGYTAEPRGKDYLVDLANSAMQHFSLATMPGRWVVDVVPFRKWILVTLYF